MDIIAICAGIKTIITSGKKFAFRWYAIIDSLYLIPSRHCGCT
jgi:hypothetical protein